MSLDDFPECDSNSELAALAETKFEAAIAKWPYFLVQQRDRRDYGTDFQLEAKSGGRATNFRMHVQLKGTEKKRNLDGSVSISVDRSNLNYLLSQPNSIYVCYHAPTGTLLYRSAQGVFREAEHSNENWRSQSTITINHREELTAEFQAHLADRVIAFGKSGRTDRLSWVTTPFEQFPRSIHQHVPTITVPETADEAFELLMNLYESNQDAVISKAFDQFLATIGEDDMRGLYVFLAEINLAMCREPFEETRVQKGIEKLESLMRTGESSIAYSLANAHLAVKDFGRAKALFRDLIARTDIEDALKAMALKNLGSTLEEEGNHAEARTFYLQALECEPNLMEAHFSLGMAYQQDGELEKAVSHYNQVIWANENPAASVGARGHRLRAYFQLGRTDMAFQEIGSLLEHANKHDWILPWCGRFVFNYARQSGESVNEAQRFWDMYVRKRRNECLAKEERLKLLAFAKMHSQHVTLDFDQFKSQVESLVSEAGTEVDAAHLWDRVGHWAQKDENWENAEVYFRMAFGLEPERYGYCLGTALNSLHRYDEALPILKEQAEIHMPDAMTWGQLARAQEKLGQHDGCKDSLRKAIELNPDYEIAYFNLGGVHWNLRERSDTIAIWSEALVRFPDHELSLKLRNDFPQLFPHDV